MWRSASVNGNEREEEGDRERERHATQQLVSVLASLFHHTILYRQGRRTGRAGKRGSLRKHQTLFMRLRGWGGGGPVRRAANREGRQRKDKGGGRRMAADDTTNIENYKVKGRERERGREQGGRFPCEVRERDEI